MHETFNLRRNRTLVAACSLSLLVAVGCKKDTEATDVTVTVQAAHPTQAAISEEIAADAILAPLSQAAIAPRVSGPIRAEYVQRGTRVHKGQLLVALDARDLQGSALDSKGTLASAQASYTAATNATVPEDLKKAQTDVDLTKAARDVARRTADERRTLFQQGALSSRDADTAYSAAVQAQSAYDVAVKHLDSVVKVTQQTTRQTAEGQLTSARGKLINAEAQVDFANLRSPINGVVTDRPLFPGETATAGTPVVTVMDTSSLLAKLHLAQATAQKLTIGHKAEVHIPGIEEAVEATVSFISPALDAGSTTVEVWLKLPNASNSLKVGTPVHVVILGTTFENAIQIPKDAILPANDGSTTVMLVGADGKGHKRPVKIGVRTEESAQVLSGLALSDTVVTTGGYGLDEGTKVTVGKAGAAEDKD